MTGKSKTVLITRSFTVSGAELKAALALDNARKDRAAQIPLALELLRAQTVRFLANGSIDPSTRIFIRHMEEQLRELVDLATAVEAERRS